MKILVFKIYLLYDYSDRNMVIAALRHKNVNAMGVTAFCVAVTAIIVTDTAIQ
jgi:hypothetical protein